MALNPNFMCGNLLTYIACRYELLENVFVSKIVVPHGS